MLLPEDFWNFIAIHSDEDANKLRLKYCGKGLPFDVRMAIDQIECRNKTIRKLPSLIADKRFLFPSVLSSEQCTSEILAKFHASLIEKSSSIIDLTCGLGIDDIYMYPYVSHLITFDINQQNVDCARHNFELFGMNNARVICDDSIEWLKNNPNGHFDTIFADPARRGDNNKRTYALSDCSPNITASLPLLRKYSDRLLLKVSPMLDITAVCKELECVNRLWILSIKNECKEVFAECILNAETIPDTEVIAMNFDNDGMAHTSVSFHISDPIPKDRIFSGIITECKNWFLYEPEPSLIKTGRTSLIANKLNLIKLHNNSQIYISNRKETVFPGKVFAINGIYTLRACKKGIFTGSKRNIVCRNFPIKSFQIAKELKIKEGAEDTYLIATTTGPDSIQILFDCTLQSKFNNIIPA